MKLWIILLAAGAALELSHYRVVSGTAGGDPNSVSSIEGTLANFDELTGPHLRLGIVLLAAAAYLYFKRK